MNRIADKGIMVHMEEIKVLNDLIFDLRKFLKQGGCYVGNYDSKPITDERLDECSKALFKISQCRKQGLYK